MDYLADGVKVHDAQLVAVMLVYGMSHILTFDTKGFSKFAPEGIVVLDPAQV